ncbi:sodium- and chloride-dependent transporter XTRP3A-like isoform X1 [Dendronephthya gigantea]|uniref:sodium- and chloride-dependent transporter XTRP3A-like isoform X1 n=1 Tax=Dendronephthya gigantea TaxID=151771 RepID=UPI001069CA1C|nr:sodium- and chloride-dependent transporter XTRP3A-like isoform X1 [Dendronephthya gigantea]XP_028392285.1 sodium- and chloride-dependent transporter XTRP3A-like isoform X1 [Dendronephthya gigantea]XP_028392286.1 sodium- and chloride-dependent transporter XTRP3A-like isoform X1 [Dendronephthya gigantea]XP_028392287.1 sodium- and chloride-dependent transporter XTRP3A-like isoform X1 [Dendronephthya gigantea]XP_028392288.1 sodium- and chloride-dependent transporter XTRP3A-like isoform X1 [Dendr
METTKYTLLTPKERARLVLNSAFANNVEKYVNACNKTRETPSDVDETLTDAQDSNSPLQSDVLSGAASSTEEASLQWYPSDFYVSMLNYSLGFGTVLGFPRLCYKHGGGIFIIPYLIMLFLEGIPLVCVEIAIGQHFQEKFLLRTWKHVHPSTIGLGFSAVFISFLTIVYFNIIVGWCASYFVYSLQRCLPWTSCPDGVDACTNSTSPSEYYWYKTKLGVAEDINSVQDVNWDLYLYVFISWVLVLLYNIKGVKSAVKPGYIILITAVVLYVALFLLVVHLEDWARGLAILVDFKMDQINKLLNIEIWRDAATQVFFSLGIGYGTIFIYSSYNKASFKCKTAALCYGLVDTTVGICSCIIVFSLQGFQAHIKHAECLEKMRSLNGSLVEGGDGGQLSCNASFLSQPIPDAFSLAFISWSESFTHIAYPPLWSSLSYFLLFLSGFGSMSGMVFVVVLFVREITSMKHEYATGLVCFVSCIIGLVFVTDSGLYLVNLFHGYSSCSIQWIALLEILSVICFFGRKNFCTMVEEMTGERLHFAWSVCWFIISPAILITLIVLSLYDMSTTEGYLYSTWRPFTGMQDILYPSWCYGVIALFCVVPLVLIFAVFIVYSVKSRHVLFEMCHNFWKRLWYWCRKQEEYELQDFAEVQQCYQGGGQILLDRIDANFPELLSFDNIETPVVNGHANGDFPGMPNNNIEEGTKTPALTRRLSI